MAVGPSTVSFELGIRIKNIIFAIIVLTIIYLFVLYSSKINLESYQAESEIFIHRALYSPNGLSYYDSVSGRLYPGIIDISKFENNTIRDLDKVINYGKDIHVGAKFRIKNLDNNIIYVAFYNPRTYERKLEAQEITDKKSPGGFDLVERQTYVLIKSRNKIQRGILDIEVVIGRSI